MKKLSLVFYVLVLVLLAQGLAAQTTARLRGQVTDVDGGALPGVTVTVSGDALISGSRTATTGAKGTYSFSALPLGSYSVRAELEGFQGQVTERVRAQMNMTTTVSFQLTSTFTEALVVTGEAPLVNLTSSSMGSNYDSEFIEDLPLNRFHWDMMALSPGVSGLFNDNSGALTAFGAGVQNHAWKVDGVYSGSPYVGTSWWYVNPDTIEEVQVLGIGAPAEFGNMIGAAFNVVTKSGGNDRRGSANVFWQDDSLTDSPDQSELGGSFAQFPEYFRDEFTDATLSLGGPIKRDKVWYFLAGQYSRDGFTQAGIDPASPSTNESDRYDAKLNFQIGEGSTLDVKFHFEDWLEAQQGSSTIERESLVNWFGESPGWGLNYNRVLNDRTFLELKYGGWEGDMHVVSQTGSTEPAKVVGEGPSGPFFVRTRGLYYPFDFDNSNEEGDAVISHFAEDFVGGDHDFKFGVSYTNGDVVSTQAPGPNGYYDYYYYYESGGDRYLYGAYRYFQRAYTYGAEVESLAAFVDDSWQVNDKLTLNLGVRFDSHQGSIPDFESLDFTSQPTGDTIPGVDDAIEWDLISPRIGFAYNPDDRTVVRGSFGIYYDKVVASNWDIPTPQQPPIQSFHFDPATGEIGSLFRESLDAFGAIDPDLDAPRATQFMLGFERQLKTDMAFGAQLIYKETDDLVGWEIGDDGVYEEVSWTNPVTGEVETLLSEIVAPSLRKGNQAGFTVLGPDTEYFQEYRALILTFNKRFTGRWSLMSSYTFSESEGLIPRSFSNFQNNGLFSSRLGTDPNNWLNAEQLLQGDREHMFRVQTSFNLPWDLVGTASVNLQSGRPFNRQMPLPRGTVSQGRPRVTLVPSSDDQRYGFQELIDVAVGKRFELGAETVLKLDLQVFNLLNDDEVERWASLIVGTGDYTPRQFTPPRRVMLRLGLQF